MIAIRLGPSRWMQIADEAARWILVPRERRDKLGLTYYLPMYTYLGRYPKVGT